MHQPNVDNAVDGLDSAYASGQEDMGRQVLEFTRQLVAEEDLTREEILERIEQLVEDNLAAVLTPDEPELN